MSEPKVTIESQTSALAGNRIGDRVTLLIEGIVSRISVDLYSSEYELHPTSIVRQGPPPPPIPLPPGTHP